MTPLPRFLASVAVVLLLCRVGHCDAFVFSSFTSWNNNNDRSGVVPNRKTIAIAPPKKEKSNPLPNRKTVAISQPQAKKLIDSSVDVHDLLKQAKVVDPRTGKMCNAVDGTMTATNASSSRWSFNASPKDKKTKKALVVVMPQLGDFDSMEYGDLLQHVLPDLKKAQIELRIVGIGNAKTAHMFSMFTGIPLQCIRVDPEAAIHKELKLHRGPDWDIPSWLPDKFVNWIAQDVCRADTSKLPADEVARAWLNYLAMCGGISAPGTLGEIARGYFGDKSAPERVGADEIIRAGPVTIKGVTDFKIGPLQYKSKEYGYQRPGELAGLRLRSMNEVLTKFDSYVHDQRLVDWRGATFLLDEHSNSGCRPSYEYRDTGVLSYSETMDRPLSFLTRYIGVDRARNPMGLHDPEVYYD